MKLDDALALIAPFLATDKKPDEVKAIILAADKAAKDKAAKDKAKDAETDPERTNDEDPEEEPKPPKGKDKGAKDKAKDKDMEACDEEEIDAEDNDLEQAETGTPSKGGRSEKGAMDAATVEQIVAKAVARRDALHTALNEVEPIIGKRAFDSAGDAYKAALDHLGVDLTDVPPSAYRAVLTLAKGSRAAPVVAMDSSSQADVLALIPHLNRL